MKTSFYVNFLFSFILVVCLLILIFKLNSSSVDAKEQPNRQDFIDNIQENIKNLTMNIDKGILNAFREESRAKLNNLNQKLKDSTSIVNTETNEINTNTVQEIQGILNDMSKLSQDEYPYNKQLLIKNLDLNIKAIVIAMTDLSNTID